MEKAIPGRCLKWLIPLAFAGLACGRNNSLSLVFGHARYTLAAYPGKTTTFVELANKSKKVRDVDLTTSCGCMNIADRFRKITLAPGQLVRVPVEISLEKDSDTKQLVIATSQGMVASTTVDVRVKWPVQLDRSQIDLGVMDISSSKGTRKQFVLNVDAGVKNVSLRSLSPVVDLKSSQQGNRLTVLARLDESAPLGDSSIPVELTYQNSSQTAKAVLPLKMRVRADQFFEPPAVSFGVVKIRESAARSVVFRSRTQLTDIKVESRNSSILAKLVDKDRNSRTLRLSWTPFRTGGLKSEVDLTLADGTIKRLTVSGFAIE